MMMNTEKRDPKETREELLDIAMIMCDVWMEKILGEVVRERTGQ